MSYRLDVMEKSSYLHVTVTGTHSAENARQFLAEIHDICVQRDCHELLVELNVVGPSLPTGTIFDVVSEGSRRALRFRRLAYVDASAERDLDNLRFVETVAKNRGVNIRFFRKVDEAENWMRAPEAAQR